MLFVFWLASWLLRILVYCTEIVLGGRVTRFVYILSWMVEALFRQRYSSYYWTDGTTDESTIPSQPTNSGSTRTFSWDSIWHLQSKCLNIIIVISLGWYFHSRLSDKYTLIFCLRIIHKKTLIFANVFIDCKYLSFWKHISAMCVMWYNNL